MDNIRLISKKDPWYLGTCSPAKYEPIEDLMIITNWYVKNQISEEQIILEIPSIISHESLERESFKLIASMVSDFLNSITWNIEEYLDWPHVSFGRQNAIK